MKDSERPALLVQADALEHLGHNWSRRGLNVQAADALRRAAALYCEAGDWYMAFHCQGRSEAILSLVRPPARPNISALVD